ncbi:MAG: bifunctional riboflavin kinase/FAD synthetase [Aquificae bacterium]|nr:bifunctional riboflavin kinase/FAD synthetase [Aquificota bacterium]
MKAFLLDLNSSPCEEESLPLVDRLNERTAVVVGNFDGVHLGHKFLVEKIKRKAKERNLKSLVLTFCPHPLKVLAPQLLPCELSDISEKIELFEELGVDYLCFIKFDTTFARLRAKVFLKDILKERLGCEYLLVGYDWRYGYKREGEIELAKEMGKELGFEVELAPPYRVNGTVVSSTLIRRLLKEGRIEEAKTFLGHPYWIKRKVVKGEGRGSGLGFPTANLANTENLCLKEGVYAVVVDDKYKAVANYGRRPTFGGEKKVLEVHIPGFSGDLRGKKIKVEFVKFLREERRFKDKDELISQIKRDVQEAMRVLG